MVAQSNARTYSTCNTRESHPFFDAIAICYTFDRVYLFYVQI